MCDPHNAYHHYLYQLWDWREFQLNAHQKGYQNDRGRVAGLWMLPEEMAGAHVGSVAQGEEGHRQSKVGCQPERKSGKRRDAAHGKRYHGRRFVLGLS